MRVLAGVSVAVALLAGACTNTSSAPPPSLEAPPATGLGGALGAVVPEASKQFLGDAAQRTADSGTGRLVLDLVIDGTDTIDGRWVRVEGAFNIPDERAQLEVTPSALAQDSGVTYSTSLADLDEVYVQDETVAAAMGVDTPWMRYRDECGASGLGQGLIPLGGADAGAVLGTVERVGSDVEEIGTERVGGFDAVHYRASVDVAAAVEEVAPACRADWEDFAGTEVPVDLWIHPTSGVVMRETITFELADFIVATSSDDSPDVTGVTGTLEYRIEFFDLGEPVTFELPPEADITDVDKADYEQAVAGLG